MENFKKRIEEIMMYLISIKSDTATVLERDVEEYIYHTLEDMAYFKSNPQNLGYYPLKNDPLKRSVVWGLVKGEGKKTVVFLHHHDVVDSHDYGILKDYAYDPKVLIEKIKDQELSQEVRGDLESGNWIFARGAADMKAGAAIQLALMEEYSEQEDLVGNILMISVPDEESLSLGMRCGTELLKTIQEKFDVSFSLLIDSEPHQREDDKTGIIYTGSVGKLMPVIYVRGIKTHIGHIFQGFNPVVLLSEIVRNTELNPDFSDVVGDEVSPPPSWSFCRDGKKSYDASIPESAAGYFSILTLTRTPKVILDQLIHISTQAFQTVIDGMQGKYNTFLKNGNAEEQKLPWKVNVKTFGQLYAQAVIDGGDAFIDDYNKCIESIKMDIDNNKMNMPESNFMMIEKTLEYISDRTPMVVIAFSPPYYPHVTNINMKNLPMAVSNLEKIIDKTAQKEWGETYENRHYFMGISDMSYGALNDSEEVIPHIAPNMPLWESLYDIPFESMKELSIPCVNIGPWGKDYHKFTERVLAEDVFYRTPKLIRTVTEHILINE